MRFFKLLFVVVAVAALQSCKKENSPVIPNQKTRSITGPNATLPVIPVYQFTSPQLIYNYNLLNGVVSPNLYPYNYFSVSKSHIAEFQYWGAPNNSLILINTSDYSSTTYKFSGTFGYNAGSLDLNETNYYMTTGGNLFKFNLATLTVTKLAGGLGNIFAIKPLANTSIALTTDSLNGSLVVVGPNGGKGVIAKNLGFAGDLDVFNNQFYVVDNNIIDGAVLNITGGGVVTTIVNNLTEPTKIVADIYGNLIVKQEITISGSIYDDYIMYTPTGSLIGPVTDSNGTKIISQALGGQRRGAELDNGEMYVDKFDNLFFDHIADGSGNSYPGGINSAGIWKIGLLKQ